MIDLSSWSFGAVAGAFLAAAVVIAVAGSRLAATADRLADITGLGEAIFGAVLLGGSTSLPGIVTSVATAYQGFPELSISNAVGGIAAQTVFLAVADMVYVRANLEHAAASVENLMQGALLITLLSLPLLAMAGPPGSLFGIHPASFLLLAAYGFGLRLVREAHAEPLWQARQTRETEADEPEEEGVGRRELGRLWTRFALLALVVASAGYLVAESGIAIAVRSGLSETIVGGLFTAVATSLPELVTSVAAVRQGALTLAVGGIIGGNSFDVLFVAFADVAYREGSIYHALGSSQVFVFALTLLLTGTLLLGLLRRERRGVLGIGFESFLVVLFYLGGFGLLFFS